MFGMYFMYYGNGKMVVKEYFSTLLYIPMIVFYVSMIYAILAALKLA